MAENHFCTSGYGGGGESCWASSNTTPHTQLNAIMIKTECQQLYDESCATETHSINSDKCLSKCPKNTNQGIKGN